MKILLFTAFTLVSIGASAQKRDIENVKYHRSSIYSILLHHPDKLYDEEITYVFDSIPMPDKYDNHNLNVRAVFGNTKGIDEELIQEGIAEFLSRNYVGKRLLAKWFGRDKVTGVFDAKLLAERGVYDASYLDVTQARLSARGKALLEDAGENLIGHTYVLVNDISYVDKSNTSAVLGGIVAVGAATLSARDAIKTGNVDQKSEATELATQAASSITAIAGFRVKVTSYLYSLEWNDTLADAFYGKYYTDVPDREKKVLFDKEKELFKLNYVGNIEVASGNTTTRGVVRQEDMIRKVCARAIDKAVAMLQHKFESFRVKVPLHSIAPLTAKVGIKEEITEQSRFEVLEAIQDDEGRVRYKRVGVIKPVKGKIWDNQYMAEFEENQELFLLGATEFEKVSGGDFYEGMLIREIE